MSKTTSEAGSERLGDFSASPRMLFISAVAAAVGALGVVSAFVLLNLIQLCGNLAYLHRLSFSPLDLGSLKLGPWSVAVPMVGALIIGLMARFGSEKIRGHGIPEAIEAILLGRSRLDPKVAVLKPLSSAISIGTGGPFGAEGPIIMTGGAVGSLIAQLLPVSDSERKALLVAGASAGMTAVFGTPIAAVMLAVELLLFEWTPKTFVPVAVAAIIADVGRTWLGMPSPLFAYSGGMPVSAGAVAAWVAMGLVCGLLACILTQAVYACEDRFEKFPIHWMWWPVIGGAVIGLGGLADSRALGVGYVNIAHLIEGGLVGGSALKLLVVKVVIWAVALGSGTSGGVLAPLLIIGGALGAAIAPVFPTADPGFWPLLAMAATMGGTMRSPLTATFFAVELTGDNHILLPVLAASVAAHICTVLLMKRSILTEKVARRGHHVFREYRVDPFALARVAQIMTPEVETAPSALTLHGAVRLFTNPETRHPSFPVVEPDGRVLGVLDAPTVLAWRKAGHHRTAQVGELMRKTGGAKYISAYPDEFVDNIIQRMTEANVARAVVISRKDQTLAGYLNWKDVAKVQARLRREESNRVAFFGAQ